MSLGLFNAASTCEGIIKDVFRDVLDVGVIADMDDILIDSEAIEEHVPMLRKVMDSLRTACQCVSIKK